MTSTQVRPVRPGDAEEVLEVVLSAFRSIGAEGGEEVDIVRRTWELGASVPGLDLVAEVNGQVVGHALGATVDLAGRTAIGLAPLSVHADHQRRGVGSVLVHTLLGSAEEQGWPLVVLLGSPLYYGRFGFEPAGDYGIVYPPVGAGDEHFQVWRASSFDPSWQGPVTYCWELDGR